MAGSQPNQLKSRPPFTGDTRDLIRRWTEEIEELQQMRARGFEHTSDGESIETQIRLREDLMEKAKSWVTTDRGRWLKATRTNL